MTLKFLVDEALSPRTVVHLQSLGHDAIHMRERLPLASPDSDIVALAQREGRIIVTADLDYGHLLIASASTPPSAIILRLDEHTLTLVNQLLTEHLPRIATPLSEGALVVIEEDDVRIRRLADPRWLR